MSVNTTVKLTRVEVRVLEDYWVGTYECLDDEEFDDEGIVEDRIEKYSHILDVLIDNDSPVEQLKRL